jgi:hypothetical protein
VPEVVLPVCDDREAFFRRWLARDESVYVRSTFAGHASGHEAAGIGCGSRRLVALILLSDPTRLYMDAKRYGARLTFLEAAAGRPRVGRGEPN